MLWDEARPVRRESIAELLWGEWDLPDHWTGAVRGVVAKVRGVLEAAGLDRHALSSSGGLTRLELPPNSTMDLAEAEALVGRAAEAIQLGETVSAEKLAGQAATLLAHPLAISGDGEWHRRLHLRAETFARQAGRLVVRAQLAGGRNTEAIAGAAALVTQDRLDEVAHELLIAAYLAAGEWGEARSAHATLLGILESEIGAPPSPHIATLFDRAAAAPPATPVAPASVASERFLGRRHELSVLGDAADRVGVTGTPGLVVVQGPTGIGKSRLVAEFLERHPVRCLWGRCHADVGEPFEAFVDAFAGLLGDGHSDESVRRSVTEALEVLVDEQSPARAPSARDRRARAMRAVIDAFDALGAQGPVTLVVDDLQWASGDSIVLLQRLLERTGLALFVIVTARDGVDQPGRAAELLRAAPTAVVSLEPLAVEDIQPLVDDLTAIADRSIDADQLSAILWERTGGLPYFLAEIARDASRRRSLDIDVIPDHVRAWVRNRAAALGGDQRSLVEVVAVLGRRASITSVEACWPGPASAVMPGMEQLVRAGMLTETDHPDVVEFPHQITHEIIEESIGAARRARLHARAAQVLADSSGATRFGAATTAANVDGGRPGGATPHARIAYHYTQAGPDHAAEAARHGYLAGVASLTRGAWAQAASQLADASRALGGDAVPLRAAILVALGWARHAGGDAEAATRDLTEAARLATEMQLPHEAARAALLLTGRAGRGAAHRMDDAERIERLTVALDSVTTWPARPRDHDTDMFPLDPGALATLRTAVEVELAWAMLFTGSLADRTELLTGTLARARADDAEPLRLARALVAQRNILQGPGQLPERLAVVREALALPRDRLPVDTIVSALLCHHEDLLASGDRKDARASLDAAADTVHLHAHPYWHWATATWESLWLLVNGDPDAAEDALGRAAWLQPDDSAEAAACAAVQLVAIRLAQGRSAEVVDSLTRAAQAHPNVPAYRAVLALAASSAGDTAAAERAYGHFASDGFSSIPVDSNRLLTVAVLGDVAADLGDPDGAASLDAQLAADDDVMVVLNCYGGGGSWWGPVARVRSRLADVLGRPAQAEAARGRARASLDAMGAAALGQPGL